MNKKIAVIFLVISCVVFGVFTPVFITSMIKDNQAESMEMFELLARIIGYVFVLSIDIFMALISLCILKNKAWKKLMLILLIISFLVILILCVHDVLLFATYGNELEGTFTMAIFFVLDALLVIFYLMTIYLFNKPKNPLFIKIILVMIVFTWILYIIGDMAGYSCSSITDWDEPMMKFIPMISILFMEIIIMKCNKFES